MEGVDYAWERPSPKALKDAGKSFACRYLAFTPNGKVVTRDEVVSLHAAGLSVVLNWEQGAYDMLKGYAAGLLHGREAYRQARDLGAPVDCPIYFSCDFDAVPIQYGAIGAYLDGCATALGRERVGVYGSYRVIDYMVGLHARWGWQTYAWSRGRVSSKTHLYQYNNNVDLAGVKLDLNRSMAPLFGAWEPEETAMADIDPKNDPHFWALATRMDALRELADVTVTGDDMPIVRLLKGLRTDLDNVIVGQSTIVEEVKNFAFSDDQISKFAAQFAKETDASVIENALRDVLKKGTDNAS